MQIILWLSHALYVQDEFFVVLLQSVKSVFNCKDSGLYHKSGNFHCKSIFAVNGSYKNVGSLLMLINVIMVRGHSYENIIYHTKHENFQIYHISYRCLRNCPA